MSPGRRDREWHSKAGVVGHGKDRSGLAWIGTNWQAKILTIPILDWGFSLREMSDSTDMPKRSEKAEISIQGLAREFQIDRETVRKLVRGVSGTEEAREAIRAWKAEKEDRAGDPNIDPITGMSWWQRINKLRGDQIEEDMARNKALAGGELITTGAHNQCLELVWGFFDRLPADFYAYGNTEMSADQRQAFTMLCERIKTDCKAFAEQWQESQARKRKDGDGTLEN